MMWVGRVGLLLPPQTPDEAPQALHLFGLRVQLIMVNIRLVPLRFETELAARS